MYSMSNAVALIVSIAIAQAAGLIGSLFTMDAIPTWYATLVRPNIAPPNWVFGPVWTTLYCLMGIAAFFIWKQYKTHTRAKQALIVYGLQLAINTTWSIVFFTQQNIAGALVIVLVLLGLIAWTMLLFGRIDKRAAYLLIPYLAWVSFATLLNYQFWRLNA